MLQECPYPPFCEFVQIKHTAILLYFFCETRAAIISGMIIFDKPRQFLLNIRNLLVFPSNLLRYDIPQIKPQALCFPLS